MPQYYDYNPSGLRVRIWYASAWLDITQYVTREPPLTITRPRPGQNGTCDFFLWVPGGTLASAYGDPKDWVEVIIDDTMISDGTPRPIYLRYFHGYARLQKKLDGNHNLQIHFDCVDFNWRWANPPAMPIVKTRVGAAPIWLSRHLYVVGDEVQPFPSNAHKYIITTAGMSGITQPMFATGAASTTKDPAAWTVSRTVIVGDEVCKVVSNGHKFICITPGVTGTAEPSWNTTPQSITTETTGTGVQWKENGSDSGGCVWTENGSSLVNDVTVINEILDIYYPQTLFPHTRTNIQNLIASVPSIEIQEGWTANDAMQAVANTATSTRYYQALNAWQASHAYSLDNGDQVEPTVKNGFIYQVNAVSGTFPYTSGGSQPTWPTIIGQTVVDNEITWICMARVGQWEASVPMIVGQRIEPDGGNVNGVYYDVITAGITGATFAGPWTTTLGTTFTNGTVGLVAAGHTAVAPIWQWDIPNDNTAHSVTWNPIAGWRDSSAQGGTTGIPVIPAAYSDTLTPDNTHVHYTDITLSADGNSFRNAWYVYGRNDSFAMVTDTASVALYGQVFAGTHIDTSDTGPSNNAECYTIATALLAQSIMKRTVSITSKDPLDSSMIQSIAFGTVENAILNLDTSFDWPLTSVSMTLGKDGANWVGEWGSPFLTSLEDPYALLPGGPEYIFDTVPPKLVTWDTTVGHPQYYLRSNYGDHYHTSTVDMLWISSQEGDLAYFRVTVLVNGQLWGPQGQQVFYPISNFVTNGLPVGATVQYLVSAVDDQGNFRRNLDGSVMYSFSPIVTTLGYIAPPPTGLALDTAVGQGGYLYNGYGAVTAAFKWVVGSEVPDFYRMTLTGSSKENITQIFLGNVTAGQVPGLLVGHTYSPSITAIIGDTESVAATMGNITPPAQSDKLINPDFEFSGSLAVGDIWGWPVTVANGGTATLDPSPHTGLTALKLLTTASIGSSAIATSYQVMVTASSYTLKFWAKCLAAITTMTWTVTWYAADGTTVLGTNSKTTILTTSYAYYTYAVTAPATTAYYTIKFATVALNKSIWIDTVALDPQIGAKGLGPGAVLPGNTDNGNSLPENGSLEIPNSDATMPEGWERANTGLITWRDIGIVGGTAADGVHYLRMGGSVTTHRIEGPFFTWAKGWRDAAMGFRYTVSTMTGVLAITYGFAMYDANKVLISDVVFSVPTAFTTGSWNVTAGTVANGSFPANAVYAAPYVKMIITSGAATLDVDGFWIEPAGHDVYAGRWIGGAATVPSSIDLSGSNMVVNAQAASITSTANIQLTSTDVVGTLTASGITTLSSELIATDALTLSGVVTKNATFTADNLAFFYLCNTIGTATANLPAAASCTGRIYAFKQIGTSKVTIDANASELIDGILTYPLSAKNQSVVIQSNGAGWNVIAQAGLVLTSDGTNWLGPDMEIPLDNYKAPVQPHTVGVEAFAASIDSTLDFLVSEFWVTYIVATTNNTTNYWKFELKWLNSGAGSASMAIPDTHLAAANTWGRLLATSFTNNPIVKTGLLLQVVTSVFGAPGTVSFAVKVKGNYIYV